MIITYQPLSPRNDVTTKNFIRRHALLFEELSDEYNIPAASYAEDIIVSFLTATFCGSASVPHKTELQTSMKRFRYPTAVQVIEPTYMALSIILECCIND
ncbi:hypothetical protein Tco_1304851 [Tanacetum coccineum]